MKSIIKSIYIFIAITIIITLINCGSKQKKLKYEGYTDQQLYDKAMQYMEKKKWEQSRELLKYLMENFYDSQLLMSAKLAYADTFFKQGGMENYIISEQQYEEYIKLYPSSINADYAQFQIALCNYNQISKPGRDQINTYKTINAIKKLIENYPRSSYIQEAQKYLIKAYENLNNHQMKIIKFYLKRKKWEPAISRFEEILLTSPKESITAEIYYYYAETLQKVGRIEDSKIYYMLLQEKFPRSKFAILAKEKAAGNK